MLRLEPLCSDSKTCKQTRTFVYSAYSDFTLTLKYRMNHYSTADRSLYAAVRDLNDRYCIGQFTIKGIDALMKKRFYEKNRRVWLTFDLDPFGVVGIQKAELESEELFSISIKGVQLSVGNVLEKLKDAKETVSQKWKQSRIREWLWNKEEKSASSTLSPQKPTEESSIVGERRGMLSRRRRRRL